jgi:hypothetical protein
VEVSQELATQAAEPDALVLRIPEGALIPEGASFYEGADDGRCRVVKLDGTRCAAIRVKAYGLCGGHAGIGGVARDPVGAARQAHAEKARRRQARLVLGISPRRAADPRQLARLRAQERAEELAAALIDAPLDDTSLSTLQRQQAVVTGLGEAFPKETAQLAIDLPDDPEAVRALSWEDLKALAAVHLDMGEGGTLEAA